MRSLSIGATLLLFAALAAGCSKTEPAAALPDGAVAAPSAPQTLEASIRTAIQAHLAHKGNLNVQAFQTDVKQVTVDGDHAQAQVEFRVKDGPGSMQLTYALERRDNLWSVIESVPVGSNFSHPPLDPSQVPTAGGAAGPVNPIADPTRFFKDATSSQTAPHK